MSVLFILLRTDLKWKTGPLAAQSAHAVSLLIHKYHDMMSDYLEQGYAMRKIVLGCSLKEMQECKENLQKDGILFCEWLEQPENVATAIAILPLNPEDRPAYLKSLKLFNK